jgi:membrane protein
MENLGKFFRVLFSLLKETSIGWATNNGSMMAAALAYSMIFSMSPLLVLATSIAGMVFSEAAVTQRLELEVTHMVGPRAAQAVHIVLEAGRIPGHTGIYATVSGLLMLLFASLVFARMKKAINVMWGITAQPGQGTLLFVRTHFLSFVMVLVAVLLLVSFMVASTLVVSINQWLSINTTDIEPLLTQADIGLTFVGFTTLFTIIFKTLPDAQISWEDTIIGAAFTSLLLTIAEYLIGFYLSRVSLRGVYGAMSSVIIVLAWVYYSMQIILFGAKFTQVYANRYGKKVIPSKKAAQIVPNLEIYD